MPASLAQFSHWLRSLLHDNGAVQAEASVETLRRFRIFASVTLLVNLGYIAEFWFHNVGQGSAQRIRWAHAVGWAHGLMALAVVVLGTVAHLVYRRRDHGGGQALVLEVLLCSSYLAFAVALSVIDQMVTTNTTNFATITLMVAMLSLMRPLLAIGMFAGAYLAFFMGLTLTQTDPDLLAMARSHGLGAVLISGTASIVMWHQYASGVLLRREIERGNQALAKKQTELEFLATHDALTGLYNRREFMRLAEMEMVRSTRVPTDTSVLMVDLDFFKKINDQYGHPAGDAVLKQVGTLLKTGVRASDVIARLGGEEFIVLLPNTDKEGALAVAEKLRNAIRERVEAVPGSGVPVTASMGVSGVTRPQQATVGALYAVADQALYVAKQSGRDRVEYLPYAPVAEPSAAAG